MPDSLDASVAKALRALDVVSTRDLIPSARALEGKHDRLGLFRFGGVFRSYAHERREGGDPWLSRIQLSSAVVLAHPDLDEQVADAEEPFWRHVREAIQARRASFEDED